MDLTDDAHCDSICAIFIVSAVTPPMIPALPTKLAISEIAPLFEVSPSDMDRPILLRPPFRACAWSFARLFWTFPIGPDAWLFAVIAIEILLAIDRAQFSVR
ncbi:hypothetical protein [Burkholderia cenocepacia]|uniref:hypothetical protein n=1 Tax=Burkholderia cenocepacia TaxID=95486 RepID=UPI002ABD1EED|nr:hypothetical protein [Burkholderia cenocepacia]